MTYFEITNHVGITVVDRVDIKKGAALIFGLEELETDLTIVEHDLLNEVSPHTEPNLLELGHHLVGKSLTIKYKRELLKGNLEYMDKAIKLLKEWGYAIHSTHKGAFHVERF